MPQYPKGTVLIPCDSCGAQMADTDDTCWKCGAKYELDDAQPQKPPPAPARPSTITRGGPVKAAPVADPDDDMPW